MTSFANDLIKSRILEYLQYLKEKVISYAQLAKLKITFFVAFSTSAGYFLNNNFDLAELIFVLLGVLLTASSASALNQIQEYKSDALMQRTKNRPLLSGKITFSQAYFFVIVSFSIGFFALARINYLAAFLSLAAALFYNLIYTNLKKISPYAIFPGSIVGAIPPIIGFIASEGNLFDMKIVLLALVFFVWQIPHFWILSIFYKDDYKRAGFPVLLDKMKLKTANALIYLLSLLTFLLCFLFLHIAIGISDIFFWIYIFLSSIVLTIFSIEIYRHKSINYKKLFFLLNVNVLFLSVFIVIISLKNKFLFN
jgi:protoheme IX farnesyltransferase